MRAAAPDAAGHRVAGGEGRRGSGEECSRSHAAASAAQDKGWMQDWC